MNEPLLQLRPMAQIVAIALIVSGFTAATERPRPPITLRAERFLLVDQQGRPRTELSVFDGGPQLRMYDKGGLCRVSIGLLDGENAYVALTHTVSDDTLADSRGLLLGGGGKDTATGLRLLDSEARTRVHLLLQDNTQGLSLYDTESHQPKAIMGIFENHGSIILTDDEGNPTFMAP